MTDWRALPRTGRSQFFPLMDEIRSRLSMGETNKQIHDDLTAQNRIEIGYDQFARYIRKHLKTAKEERLAIPLPAVAPGAKPALKPASQNHPFNFQKDERNGERRREPDFHSSVPDKERIYGPLGSSEPL